MRLATLILAIIFISSCTAPKASPNNSAEAKSAFETYVAAINSGETEKAAAMYDDGAGFHWVERGAVQYDTGANAAESLRSISETDRKASMLVDDIRVAAMGEGSALVSGHFDYSMLGGDDEPQISFDGWMTVGMVKRADGWKIAGGQTGPGKSAVEAGR